jgi:EpsI family protein
MKLAAALVFLALNAYVYFFLANEEVIPPRTSFSEFPDEVDGWRCLEREVLDEEIIERLDVTDYLSCTFVEPTTHEAVQLYVGYHQRQTRDSLSGRSTAIHPPEHCLPGSGWDVIDADLVPIDDGPGGEAKRFIIAKGNHRSLVYFWYHSRGRVIARSHEKILYMFLDRARTGRTDGSLVRFTVPIVQGDVAAAEATFREFASEVLPLIPEFIPD